jgi:hypothetical protein
MNPTYCLFPDDLNSKALLVSFCLTFTVASTWVDIVSPMFILTLFNRMGSLLIKKLSYKALFNTSTSSYKYVLTSRTMWIRPR